MKKPFEIIRDLREDNDLKQKEVADYLKIDLSVIEGGVIVLSPPA